MANFTPTKKECKITREQFNAHAKDMQANINGAQFMVNAKQFSTGSLGFYGNGKMNVIIDGQAVQCQVGINVTVVGSKELPK